MESWKLRPSTRFEISHFQPVNCTTKNPISPKVSNRFSKTLLHLIRVESEHLGRKFNVSRYFSFEKTRWKLSPSSRFETSHFQPLNCTSKTPIFPKVIDRFSKTFLPLKRYESRHLGQKFQVRRYFTFAMIMWKLSPSKNLKFSTFNMWTVPAKIPYLQRYLTDFQKLCFISHMLK